MSAIQLAFNGIKCRGVWGCHGMQNRGVQGLNVRARVGWDFVGWLVWDFMGAVYGILWDASVRLSLGAQI